MEFSHLVSSDCLGLLLIAQQGMWYNVLTQLNELYLHLSTPTGSSRARGLPYFLKLI